MSNANFSILVDFAAGGLVLASVLIVWRRDLRAIVRLLAWQGAALAAIPLLRGIRDNDRALIAVGIAVLALRALVLPWLLARAVGAEAAAQREATPLVNTASSLLITAGLTLTAFAITQPVVNLEPGVTINAVPAAFAVVLIALFVMTTRLHAVSQAAGFLMLDNGIAATAFLLTAGVPLIVELGASLDVLFAVISQAPAPVSALMSGVLLAVAFSVLIRLRPILDAVSGPAYLRNGLLVVGLATLLVAVLMLTVTGDVKRMLAYSSMEHMGLIAIAAAAGTTLAIAALLLHVLAHGIGKTVLFLAGGQLQAAHDSTAIADITGVMRRSRLIGVSFAVGLIVLLGLPPFAMFASELAIARSLANERLAWVLGAALLLIAIGFTALARNSGRMLLGTPAAGAPAITVPATAAAALMVGIVVSAALGITAGPLADLLGIAASNVGLP